MGSINAMEERNVNVLELGLVVGAYYISPESKHAKILVSIAQ
jgi:hypothetical protein